MESHKRFRADISDSYIKTILTKKRYKPDERKQAIDTELQVKAITIIPSQMLPKGRQTTKNPKEYLKPEHWAKPDQTPKLSRAQVFEVERDNIRKVIHGQQAWSRAARHLTSAMKPPNKSSTLDVVNPEENPAPDTSLAKDGRFVERKNRSKEFLDNFFEKASSIAAADSANSLKRKRQSPAIRKVPKLASGIKPGVEEIVL